MAENRNLYKLDDFSLILSYILLAVFLFQFRSLIPLIGEGEISFLMENVRFLFTIYPIRLGLLLFSALFFQILGRVVRKKEKISLDIIDRLNSGGRYSLSSLAFETGRTEAYLSRLLKELSEIPGAEIQFDGVTVKRSKTKAREELAKKFNMNPSTTFRAQDQKTATGSTRPIEHADDYADDLGNSVPTGHTAPLKSAGFGQSDNRSETQIHRTTGANTTGSNSTGGSPSSGNLKGFNLVLFFILFFVFWPAAFIYLARFIMKNNQQKALGK